MSPFLQHAEALERELKDKFLNGTPGEKVRAVELVKQAQDMISDLREQVKIEFGEEA